MPLLFVLVRIMRDLTDKTVLITGGTGSFGKTVAQYLVAQRIGEVRIFSRDEEKQDAMRNEFPDAPFRYFIGDVRDIRSVRSAMQSVDLVFHAAALKQVPSCEFFPLQAVQTNIAGSANVIEAAIDAEVDSVVCLSTDKAVFPVNAMGMTKALMEKVVQATCRSSNERKTVLSCVRYGNVMYSRGSVIPLFVNQLRKNKPITITHPEMTRFLMPLTAAVDLVLYAFEHAVDGDVFVKKAPAATVKELGQAVMNVLDVHNEIVNIGIRHGEKMYETLISAEELARSEDRGEYFRIALDSRKLDYSKYFTDGDRSLGKIQEYNSDNAGRLTVSEIESLIRSLPEIQQELAKV